MAGEGDCNRLPNGRSAMRQTKSRRSLASRRNSGSRAAAAAAVAHAGAATAAAEVHDGGPASRADNPAGAQAKAVCSRRNQQRPTSRAVKPRHRAPARARAAQAAATAAAVTAAAADSSIASQPMGHQEVAKDSSKEPSEPVQQKPSREEQLQGDCFAQAAEAKREEADDREEAKDRIEPEEEEEEEEEKEETKLQHSRRSVGVLTDADCLGPCEPGTHVNLDGIVWQETANGVLVINVTWRGKTYMGTLLDATKHDWAPPRLQCESPSSEAETRTSKSRIKRRPTLSATFQDINERKLRRQCRSSGGSQSESQAAAATADRATPACVKRKAKPAATATAGEGAAAASDDGASQLLPERSHSSVSKRRRSGSYGYGGGGDPADVSYLLCPEPGCTRKYRQTSSLRHHLRQAHPPARVGGDRAVAACNGSSGSNGGSSDAASAGGSPPAEDALAIARAVQQQQATNCASARSSMRLSKRERQCSRSSSTSPDIALATFSYKREEVASKHAAAATDLAVGAAAAAAPTPMDLADDRSGCSRSSCQPHDLAAVDIDAGSKDIHGNSGSGAANPPLQLVGPSQACAPLHKAAAVSSASRTSNGERRVTASMADAHQTLALQSSPDVDLATDPQLLLPTAGPQLDGETMLMATSAARSMAISAAVSTLAGGSQPPSGKQARGGAEEAARKGAGAQQLGNAKMEAAIRAERRLAEPEARHCRSWVRASQQQQQIASRRTGAATAIDGELLLAGEAYSDVSDEGLLADSDSRPGEVRADASAAALVRMKDEQQPRAQRSAGCTQFAYPVVAVSPRKADRSEIMQAPSSISSDSAATAAAAAAAEVTERPFLGRPAPSGPAKRPRSGEGAEAPAITSRAGSRGGAGSGNSGSSHGGGGPFADVERLAALESYYRQQQQQQQFGLPYYHWPGFASLSPYDDAAAASSFLQLMDWRAKALERQGIESLFSRAATPGGSSGGAGLPDGAGGFGQRPGWESMPPNVAVPMDMHASRYEVLRESIELKSQMARLPSPRGSSRGGSSSGGGSISGGSHYPQLKQGFVAKPVGGSPCDSESSMTSSTSSSSVSHRRQHQQQRTRPAAPASPARDCRGPLLAAGTCNSPVHSLQQRSSVSGVTSFAGDGAAPSLPADCAAASRRLAQALDSRPLQQWSRPSDADAVSGTPPGSSWPMDRACLTPGFSAKLSPLPDGSVQTSAAVVAASAAAGTATVPKGSAVAPGDAAAEVTGTSEDKRVVGFTGSAPAALLYPHHVQAAMEAADSRTLDSAACRLHQHKIHELGDVAL